MPPQYGNDGGKHAERPSETARRVFDVYPELAETRDPQWLEILDHARLLEMPSEYMLTADDLVCQSFLLMLKGTVRVFQVSEDGREVTLYRSRPGHLFLISLNNVIHGGPFRAYAETDTPVRALMLSPEAFQRAMAVSGHFRNLVLSSLMKSVCEMTDIFYDTAFHSLDMRLACLLGKLFERNASDSLNITHQELAHELGTSREVVSRLLKKLENRQHIRLSRGQIRIGKNRGLS